MVNYTNLALTRYFSDVFWSTKWKTSSTEDIKEELEETIKVT